MKFTVITLFPEMVASFASAGLLGQARTKGLVSVETLNPRAFTEDAHHTVDDRAFGGGDGMVMKVEPLKRALDSLESPRKVCVLSPQGRVWTQKEARAWADEGGHRVLVCGRYAGIDQRFTSLYADDEISLGDFVLNGGEMAAFAIIESVARLRPGVLGNVSSAVRDSFSEALLECPQFTRPREVDGLPVPAPLLSGNHAQIAAFERAVSVVRTKLLRPDLAPLAREVQSGVRELAKLNDSELRSLGITREQLLSLGDGK